MNVKELMSKVDVNRVIDAFLLMDFSWRNKFGWG